MCETTLAQQARKCADDIGLNEVMRSITIAVWVAFEQFVHQKSTAPFRFDDVDIALLETFIEMRCGECMDVEALLLDITCIRMTLLALGFRHSQLTALRVQAKRERLGKGANGKYLIVKRLCN